MIKGLKTEHFSIQESVCDKSLIELKVIDRVNFITFSKNELEELKELIEICSKYLK